MGLTIWGLVIGVEPYNLYEIIGTAEPGYSPLMKTYEQGPSFKIAYDPVKALLQIDATVPENQYLAIVMGEDLSAGTDMIMF